MITDDQFNDSFTTAGGWFLLTQFATIAEWNGTRDKLVELMYSKGFDKKEKQTATRVSSVVRIIQNGRSRDALEKVRDSERINKEHPEAFQIASDLLKRFC